jgi:nucleotide-binding universal stress UspA family protein
MKKILVPTDFSQCAVAASKAAIKVAKQANAEIYFVHFHEVPVVASHVHLPDYADHASSEQHALIGSLKNELQKWVNEAEHAGVRAVSLLATDPNETPTQYIDSLHADLIVMGSHGVKGIKAMFIGSNTQRVIRQTHVPVLVIKKTVQQEFRKILFAYDFKDDLIRPFETIREFANLWQAEIELLFVNVPFRFKGTDEVFASIKRFMHQFPKVKYTAHIYNAFDEATGIHEFAKERNVDLIALVTYGRSRFNKILSHSVAESVINQEEVPVLVLNIS